MRLETATALLIDPHFYLDEITFSEFDTKEFYSNVTKKTKVKESLIE